MCNILPETEFGEFKLEATDANETGTDGTIGGGVGVLGAGAGIWEACGGLNGEEFVWGIVISPTLSGAVMAMAGAATCKGDTLRGVITCGVDKEFVVNVTTAAGSPTLDGLGMLVAVVGTGEVLANAEGSTERGGSLAACIDLKTKHSRS